MLGFFLSKGEAMDSEILLDALERRQQERRRVKDLETALATQSQNIDTLRKTVDELRQALDAMVTNVLHGVCPQTAQRPQTVNSIASLRSVLDTVKVGQLFDVLVGGSNGRELHEVTAVNAQGQILTTRVLEGPETFVVPGVHVIRSSD